MLFARQPPQWAVPLQASCAGRLQLRRHYPVTPLANDHSQQRHEPGRLRSGCRSPHIRLEREASDGRRLGLKTAAIKRDLGTWRSDGERRRGSESRVGFRPPAWLPTFLQVTMSNRRTRTGGVATLLGRSFFPIAALLIIVGVVWWGPWITLALAYVLWRVVARMG